MEVNSTRGNIYKVAVESLATYWDLDLVDANISDTAVLYERFNGLS